MTAPTTPSAASATPRLADDVVVGVRGDRIEMVIVKDFM